MIKKLFICLYFIIYLILFNLNENLFKHLFIYLIIRYFFIYLIISYQYYFLLLSYICFLFNCFFFFIYLFNVYYLFTLGFIKIYTQKKLNTNYIGLISRFYIGKNKKCLWEFIFRALPFPNYISNIFNLPCPIVLHNYSFHFQGDVPDLTKNKNSFSLFVSVAGGPKQATGLISLVL